MGAYQALKEEGLSIPKDISIIGFDNSKLSLLVKPKLTTVTTLFRNDTKSHSTYN